MTYESREKAKKSMINKRLSMVKILMMIIMGDDDNTYNLVVGPRVNHTGRDNGRESFQETVIWILRHLATIRMAKPMIYRKGCELNIQILSVS